MATIMSHAKGSEAEMRRARGRPPTFRQSVDNLAAAIVEQGPKTLGQIGYELDRGGSWVRTCVNTVLSQYPKIRLVELGEQKHLIVDTDPDNQKTVDFIESYLKRSSLVGYKEGYFFEDWAKTILLARIEKGIPPPEDWDYQGYLKRKAELDKIT